MSGRCPSRPAFLDHDDFGLNQSKIMNVIDSNNLERDAGGKPVPTFPHPTLAEFEQHAKTAARVVPGDLAIRLGNDAACAAFDATIRGDFHLT